MSTYLSFINNTSYPLISVYLDDELITDMILKNCQSEKFRVLDGSHELEFFENRNKNFQSLYFSVLPEKNHTVVIKNDKSFFI